MGVPPFFGSGIATNCQIGQFGNYNLLKKIIVIVEQPHFQSIV